MRWVAHYLSGLVLSGALPDETPGAIERDGLIRFEVLALDRLILAVETDDVRRLFYRQTRVGGINQAAATLALHVGWYDTRTDEVCATRFNADGSMEMSARTGVELLDVERA